MTFLPLPNVDGITFSDGDWVPEPVEFTKVEGVRAATRVGNYPSSITFADGREDRGSFIAIDRLDFPQVAWWRTDLAQESLGGLMNLLAASPESILVSQQFLTDHALQIGDKVFVQIDATDYLDIRYQANIAGVFDHFPTIYEELGFGVVGNMDQLTTISGITPIHEIWLKIDPLADEVDIRKALPATVQVVPNIGQDARVVISQEKAKFERVGIFGTLSIGFLASASMAILGLLIYSYASLRERMYHFSVLHAVGLLHRQIVTQVVMEYTFLAAFGAFGGTVIGIMASRFFVPFFKFTGESGIPLPPLIPLIDERAALILAIIFSLVIVSAEVFTITTALRRRLERIR